MSVQEALNLSLYIKILKYNKKTPEEIEQYRKEYIRYTEGINDNNSEVLEWFLKYLEDNNKIEKRR